MGTVSPRTAVAPSLTMPRALHVMSKPTCAIGNLDCEYCFFLSKDELYPGSGFRMAPEVHEAYIIAHLLTAHPLRDRCGDSRKADATTSSH
jgi:sulfatase maturation enzyme AslB (radical SAM superfamily)